MHDRKRHWAIPALLLALGLLSACSARTDGAAPTAAPAPATSAPAAIAVATALPAHAPATTADAPVVESAQPAPVAEAAPVDWLQTAAVEGDYFVLGNPDAPVRILDYSDFL